MKDQRLQRPANLPALQRRAAHTQRDQDTDIRPYPFGGLDGPADIKRFSAREHNISRMNSIILRQDYCG
jgi:hypothetical protein